MTKRIKAFFRKKGADKPIFFAVFVLICLGIVMIGSASIGAVSSKGTAFAIKNMITHLCSNRCFYYDGSYKGF